MRTLVLCKRRYTGRDLLDDRYGRLFELPVGFASLGCEVLVLATGYRYEKAVDRTERAVEWRSVGLWPWPASILDAWQKAVADFRPHLIVASSDALHLILAERLARCRGIPVVLDFYDDYESFGLTQVPGVRRMLRNSCLRATRVVSVSRALARTLKARTPEIRCVDIVGNGVPADFPSPLTRAEARTAMGLPHTACLIGLAGSLHLQRGIGDLLGAVNLLQSHRADVRLVLAGSMGSGVRARLPPGTIYLGERRHGDIPLLFRALDVGVVTNRDGAFARGAFPMKLAEMVSCGLPLVAADLGEVTDLLCDRPDSRYPPGDPVALAARINSQLQNPRPLDKGLAREWGKLAGEYLGIMAAALRR